ncbi:MAG TPA: SCO family protein [Chitinophagaceae bacterium]|nr:SCO family protein [Chitinophagaceae bacterium]
MRVIIPLAGLLLIAACKRTEISGRLPFYNSPEFSPYWLSGKTEIAKTITHTITMLSFTNQDNKKVSTNDFRGKIHVADFFFTSCGSICPKMKDSFNKLQSRFMADSNVLLVSYTVTPWIDSVARLKAYADRNGVITGKWQLLTGSQKDIYALARKSYFAEEETGFNKDSSEFLHTEHFVLVDRNLRLRGIYNGTLPLEIERLTEDIRTLEHEDE